MSLLGVQQCLAQLHPLLLGCAQFLLLCQLLECLGQLGAMFFGERVQDRLEAVPHSTQGREVVGLAGLITCFDIDAELSKTGRPVHPEQLGVPIEMGLDGMTFQVLQ